jgi:hypothetical protein
MTLEEQHWRLSANRADLHDHQLPDDRAGWTTWLLMGGRGAGKTFAGAAWLIDKAFEVPHLALLGPTLHDVREVMIEGPSGLRAMSGTHFRPRWETSRKRLVWPNGAVAQAFSAEDPDSLRGPQFHAAWADEFCAWPKPAETLAMLRFGLRLGTDPRLVVTTTPRPIRALRNLIAEPGTVDTRAPTSANADHLAPAFLSTLQGLYGGTRLAAQELDGRRPGGRRQPRRRHGPRGPGPGGAAVRRQAGQGLGRQTRPGRAGGCLVRAGPGRPLRGFSGPGGGTDGAGIGGSWAQPGPGGCAGLGAERADAGRGEAAEVECVVGLATNPLRTASRP